MLKLRVIALLAVLSLALSVTGVFAQDMVELPEVDPLDVTGDIIAAGSSTVFPLSARMAERFGDEGYADQITVDSIGSGAGYSRFCVAAETDIANASRPIKDSEIESCVENGRTPIEFRVGTDALAVSMKIDSEFVESLTLAELALVFSDAPDGAAPRTWADINAEYPAEAIQRFIPGTDSGTFDYFVEAIFQGLYDDMEAGDVEIADPYTAADFQTAEGENLAEAIAAAEAALEADAENEDLKVALDTLEETRDQALHRPILSAANTQLSENDNQLVIGIEGSDYAIGFFGFAYYQENTEALRVVGVEGVVPDGVTAEDGTYPLARPLFMYSDATIMHEKPQVAAFINFYLTHVNEEIVEVGYFPASDEALNAAKQAWLDAMGDM